MNARFAISMCAFVLAGNAMADDAANGVVMIESQNAVCLAASDNGIRCDGLGVQILDIAAKIVLTCSATTQVEYQSGRQLPYPITYKQAQAKCLKSSLDAGWSGSDVRYKVQNVSNIRNVSSSVNGTAVWVYDKARGGVRLCVFGDGPVVPYCAEATVF